jgi:chromosome segregation ATPase
MIYNNLVNRRLKELEAKFHDLESKVNEVNGKLVDFDLMSIMRGKGSGSNIGVHVDNDRNDEIGVSSHQIEELIMLIQNMEKKQNKKWEEVKKYEEDITKLKNEMLALRSGLESTNKDLSNTNNTIEIIFGRLDETNKMIQTNYEAAVENTNERISSMKRYVDGKFDELKAMIDEINLNMNNMPLLDSGDKKGDLSEADMKLLKDLLKRVTDLEKQFKLLTNSINVDLIMKEIGKFNDILPLKANVSDLSELREQLSKIVLTFRRDSHFSKSSERQYSPSRRGQKGH